MSVVLMALPADACTHSAGAATKPERIVSLNMCTDELVLRLAQPSNIASVTWLSRDPINSNVSGLAVKLPVNHGLAEETIPLNPDLVLAGLYTTRTAVALMKRTGLPLTEIGIPRNIADIRQQIRAVANLVGEPENGEQVVAAMDRRLASLPAPSQSSRPRAMVLNPNGFTVGRGTLVDDIITRAGMTNIAAERGFEGQNALETVVMSNVDVLIVSASRDGPPARATELLRHPVLVSLPARTQVVVMPSRLWSCAGPAVVDAIERLRNAADEFRRAAASQ